MKNLLNEIHDIIEQGDNGTPHDLIDVMFSVSASRSSSIQALYF